MRRTCIGLLSLIAAMPGCARWGDNELLDPNNGFSRQWLTTDPEAQSRTDTLIQKSQTEATTRVARPPAKQANTQSSDQNLGEESASDK